jgi:hypothetical protein
VPNRISKVARRIGAPQKFSFLIAGWLERKMQERKIRGFMGGGFLKPPARERR